MSRPLTQADKVAAFKVATASFARHINEHGVLAMDDPSLEAALRYAFGTYAGQCGPGQLHVTWQGSGLRIWASWHIHNTYSEKPILAGRTTLWWARDVYGVTDPSVSQLSLF
jgi:hypothetical protein